jgi:LPS sulfotransferase NodH
VVSEAIRQRLKYVEVSDPDISLERFPDFLIVGPQRTGTTWLHAHLRYHPDIMLAEPKEIFFFSSLKTPDSRRFRSNELAHYLQFFREPLWHVALRHAVSLWRYRQLYRPKIRGEATASYAALERDIIADITALKPAIKVILTIRDPVERAWSHAKKDLVRNRRRRFEDVAPSEFEQFFTDPYQRQCAHVTENVDNWAAYLQAGHLLVALFDDIGAHPEALLLEAMSFLGVRSDRRYISRAVRKRVNPTAKSKVPDRYRRFLEALLQDDLARLQQRFGLSWSPQSAGGLDRRLAVPDQRFILALHQR